MENTSNLKEVLKAKGMSQSKLSALSELHHSTVSLLATGRLRPTEEQRRRVAEVLMVDAELLWPKSSEVTA